MTSPTKVGRYEIVRRIGASMTDVFLAIDTVENRKAALKLIKTGGDSTSRMILEAERRGAAIQREMFALDPRVVEVYDCGEVDGYFFVAMQFVEGRNLAELLRADRLLDANRAAVIAIEICEQLAKFHSWQSAVVHGDIKPSNIHIGHNDTVRLLDFGIAKTLRAGRDATAHNFGSPGYCSPERLTRSEVDQQSDLWAVGATLYEMLTGEPPFQAPNTRKLEALIRSKQPPRALPGSVPKALRLIVSKSMAAEEARRYRSAVEFMADLQAFLSRKPTLAELERRGWNANATLDAARAVLQKATRTVKRVKRHWKIAGGVAWFAAGMALWIGGALAWQSWPKPVAAKNPAPAPVAAKPVAPPVIQPVALEKPAPTIDWVSKHIDEASAIIDAYRASSDPVLHDFDWHKAEIRLQDAIDSGRDGDEILGKLSLVKGYAVLERLSVGDFTDARVAEMRKEAHADFDDAAHRMPASADPHLALARIFVYSMPNLDQALAELHQAETLGATVGPREIEEQADSWRIRAQQLQTNSPRQAWRAAQTARTLYRRIPKFDRTQQHLQELALIHPTTTHPPAKKPAHRSTRWR